MQKRKVTLRNDFHNTATKVIVGFAQCLTPTQEKRARANLCGIAGCTCGMVRGPQDQYVEWTPYGLCVEWPS